MCELVAKQKLELRDPDSWSNILPISPLTKELGYYNTLGKKKSQGRGVLLEESDSSTVHLDELRPRDAE